MSFRFPWPRSVAAGRWSGFGPYYAMFPVSFAKEMIERYVPEGGGVIDPFCGRGTVPFVAKASGKYSFGCDINPVAWVFASVKTAPCNDPNLLILRLTEIAQAVRHEDFHPENEFQGLAWAPQILGFLRAARRELDWKNSLIDRTLMGFILVHLHAKSGNGISNQMRQSKAMAPDYAVKWWKERSLEPPEINPVTYFTDRIAWRYAKGIVEGPAATVILGDSKQELGGVKERYDLILTSPPYCGITDYKYDNWIRLWLLGGSPLPGGDTSQKYSNKALYKTNLRHVLEKTVQLLRPDGKVCVRTDTREFTLNTTTQILQDILQDHKIFVRQERPEKTQTALYGDRRRKPGETDILALTNGALTPDGFTPL